MRVRILPSQPHCFAFGGFDIQMLDAMEAARAAGVDIQRLDIWSRDSEFDVLHVWGLDDSHARSIKWASRAGKKVVVTGLLPYVTPTALLRNAASRCVGPNRALRLALKDVDAVVVVNMSQARSAQRLVGVGNAKIRVIPNIINAAYLATPADAQTSAPVHGPYLLCTGNVCRRKNQLELAKVAERASIPLVLIGGVLTGEEDYGAELRKLTERSELIRWLPPMPPGDPRLVGAYRHCAGFVLVSHLETQPISALEALACGAPLLLSSREWAKQPEFVGARLVEPTSPESILEGMRDVLRSPAAYRGRGEFAANYTAPEVGRSYASLYEELVSAHPKPLNESRRPSGEGALPARSLPVLEKLRAQIKHWMSRWPSLAYYLMSKGPEGSAKRRLFVSPSTRIVIEGYPRSGNTYATCAFQYAQGGADAVGVAHHLHSLANVIQGIRTRLPVLVVVRTPKDAVVSYKIRHPTISFAFMLHSYILFHRSIRDLKEDIELASFDQVTEDFGAVTARVNARFGTQFACFDGKPASVEAVFKMINEAAQASGDADVTHVARPVKERAPLKSMVERELLGDAHLVSLLHEAERIFRSLITETA